MKFTIVVATYNRSKALKRCVESILAQTYTDFELVVVDDGSTDDTPEMMLGFVDARIRYVPLGKNHGAATPARNRGIAEMTGDALIIWDSDDVLLPNALATLKYGFDQYDAGVVCTSTDFYKGQVLEVYPRRPTGLLTKSEWINGTKPRDAEIIAVRKEYIGDVRFRSRGIDFMFYAEIIDSHDVKIAYVNAVGGQVFLESDDLSLTIQRKKMNPALSMERGEILDTFLTKHKQLYFDAGVRGKYAAFAYGSAVGLLLAGKQRRAMVRAWHAFFYSGKFLFLLFFLFSLVPGAPIIFRSIISRKT
jgi:glycosyltransferase involved in cell wall biosynthesis